MKIEIARILKIYPAFVFLLPVFFVFHGYAEHYDFIPAADSLKLTGVYLLAAVILYIISWLFLRNREKSSIFTFLLLAYYFFFGPVHDWLKNIFPGSIIIKYIFILPATLVFFIAVLIFLKKRKKTFFIITRYLNLLFLLLILIDAGLLLSGILSPPKNYNTSSGDFSACNNCPKPDIYLILADEYAGEQELAELFNFDNSRFYNELKKRGFYTVEKSISNYNFTHFSMASMLNMEFLNNINRKNSNVDDMNQSFKTIKDSKLFKFLTAQGYKIYNYSVFDFHGQPSIARPTLLPIKTKPLISQTFLYRMQRDLWYHLVTDLKIKSVIDKSLMADNSNNNKLYNRTLEAARNKDVQPKFVYTHLVLPHYPYYNNSDGRLRPPDSLTRELILNPDAYIEYLRFANTRLLQLIDSIKYISSTPPVILLMSDHGCRESIKGIEEKYQFMNLNSVYFPDSNYTGFYKGMSMINQFRVILNNRFRQNLPMRKDSTIFIID
jgi:hypothetical protein